MVFEDLITPYGILRPLCPKDFAELRLSLSTFEESCGLILAPYLLDTLFLDRLKDLSEQENDSQWSFLWALVHDDETIVGFMDISDTGGSPGTFTLHWTINPEWISSQFACEALKVLVDKAFEAEECRAVRSARIFRSSPEMDGHFLRLGFRKERDGEQPEYRLSKAVEGRLL